LHWAVFTFWLVVPVWELPRGRLLGEGSIACNRDGTGSFSTAAGNGSKDARFGMWIDGERMRGKT